MGNCRFENSFTVALQAMKMLRINNPDQPRQADVRDAFRAAELEFEQRFLPTPAPPAPTVRWKQPEEPVLPRKPKSYTHRERWFTFSNGDTWVRCEHCECTLGIDRKTHIDGVRAGTLYFTGDFKDSIPEVVVPEPIEAEEPEETLDQREPLIAEPQVPVAGQDDDLEVEQEQDEIAGEGLTEVECG